ncbi:AMP-binding protein [Rhodococcoides fascians]|uniref:AMP-binding protein n=1 Tax=Rhodococcoides fascians TaxID=1828 RepID=UPI000692405A|nr:AMP-binding protein [Rhodococcus fascians]
MIYKSPLPDVDIPNSTVFEYVFGSIDASDMDRDALIDGETGKAIGYRALVSRIEAVAGALASRGVAPGDVVAVHAPNSPEFAVVLHAILLAGATATPVNVLYTAEDVAKQLAASGASYLFTASNHSAVALEAALRCGISGERTFAIGQMDGHLGVDDLVALDEPAPALSVNPRTHPAVLPFSSGTTGTPKGVVLTHRNLVANIAQSMPHYGLASNDVVLGLLPFFHVYGLTVLLNVSLKTRARVVTIARFDLENLLTACVTHRLTYLFIAPPVAVLLAKHPSVDKYDLSSVRVVLSGAAALDETLGRRVADRLDARVLQGYGMSELSPTSHVIPFARTDLALSSVGLPISNTENRLVDVSTGDDIAIPDHGMSAPGELLVRGPNVMQGYLNNPAATAETIDSDGFLHTGDIAAYDAQGAVHIVDRLKELIKYKGYQVPPAELEAVILAHPGVADVAVVGASNSEGEEVPKAFVVAQPDWTPNEDVIIDYVAERVSPHKKVRSVQFIDIIPKSASGKILRRELRTDDRNRNQQERRHSEAADLHRRP